MAMLAILAAYVLLLVVIKFCSALFCFAHSLSQAAQNMYTALVIFSCAFQTLILLSRRFMHDAIYLGIEISKSQAEKNNNHSDILSIFFRQAWTQFGGVSSRSSDVTSAAATYVIYGWARPSESRLADCVVRLVWSDGRRCPHASMKHVRGRRRFHEWCRNKQLSSLYITVITC